VAEPLDLDDRVGVDEAEPRWLDDTEAAAWRAYLLMTHLLQRELDSQLQRDAGMPHTYYGILARLSDQSPSTIRVTDIAADLDYSQSRTSHALTRMEAAGWIARRPCTTDRRITYIELTDTGREVLTAAAPGHVRCVRENFLDHLTPAQVRQLKKISDAVIAAIADDCR
jgi:DNA-binding MarR family transcriptional regulator